MIAGPPEVPPAVPDTVKLLAQDGCAHAVWCNGLGGTTFEVHGTGGHRFIKWAPADTGIDLASEVRRLRWAARYTAVPKVLSEGRNAEGQWLVTAALPGASAVTSRWKADPHGAAVGLGKGLRQLHDTLPVELCPFDWSARRRIADASRRPRDGELRLADWPPKYTGFTVKQALRHVSDPPPVDRLVVCHGDACAPNTLLYGDGHLAGHVDLGSLGLADRWADLAVATWSTEWNYGLDLSDVLLTAYDVCRDQPRIDYYRLLWTLDT